MRRPVPRSGHKRKEESLTFSRVPAPGGRLAVWVGTSKSRTRTSRSWAWTPRDRSWKAFFDTGELTGGEPYKVEGIGSDKIPGALDMSVTDRWITVTDAESFAMTRRVAREEGLFAGGSSGLVVHAALEIAKGRRRGRGNRDPSCGLG